ncbi:hypothetical protein ROSEINA2194_01902 [Roseburia inulinivorans DSM 16841]|uniref:Uncharacterized protein n=1 Tax=Roseburia inulinivorans DSM 16841 TaxID=622312 RepID=C0FT36_9FIRM|nr:hypothetical protein ROSEINA2194_01902 [Roseburia inulinivorans DSM 16841]
MINSPFLLLCKSVSMSGIRMLHSAKVCQHYSFSQHFCLIG